jgi:hypothetical protein
MKTKIWASRKSHGYRGSPTRPGLPPLDLFAGGVEGSEGKARAT